MTGKKMTAGKRWAGLTVFLVVCLGAGGLGAIATTPEIEGWYQTVAKPSWNPPNNIFGPVWTTLFVMMAISLSLEIVSLRSKSKAAKKAAFLVYFLLNF